MVRPNPTSRLSSVDPQSVDEEDARRTKRAQPFKSKASMYRNKWLLKLGVIDQKANKPAPAKPPWYQVVGE